MYLVKLSILFVIFLPFERTLEIYIQKEDLYQPLKSHVFYENVF